MRLLATMAFIVMAGVGCQPAAQELDDPTPSYDWILEGPEFSFSRAPDREGTAYVTMKVRPNVQVACDLTGPGVVTLPRITVTPDSDGAARCYWLINRLGLYEFKGEIISNGVIVETFEGEGEVF